MIRATLSNSYPRMSLYTDFLFRCIGFSTGENWKVTLKLVFYHPWFHKVNLARFTLCVIGTWQVQLIKPSNWQQCQQ